eukprot:COSAG03_NODE_22203_length_294_cov_0.774359_1_plen_21_part_10
MSRSLVKQGTQRAPVLALAEP